MYIEFLKLLGDTFWGVENQSWVGPCLIHSLTVLYMMWSIFEIIHFWTVVVDESEEWSSQ